ncbi:MAG: SDR family oxidoreductase [Anaerolineales bacterium]|nr:SDR family oxidoreductase [Anaerolineales bacterium]
MRILITGASGLLGANLTLEALDAGHDVVAVCNHHPLMQAGIEACCVDLAEQGAAEDLILKKKPEVVIHCAAATNVDACEREPEMAQRLNADMTRDVARASRSAGSYMIHISTDAVFDGVKGNYSEDDAPNPINVYAASKLAAEVMVAAEHPGAAIVRTNLFGWNAQNKMSLSEWFLDRLQGDGPVPGFLDVWFSPILVNDLARVLFQVADRRLKGVYHIGGRDCISKYGFGREVATVFGLPADKLEPVSVDDVALRAQRSKKLCLQVRRIKEALQLEMPSVRAGLKKSRSLLESDYYHRLKRLVS